MKKRFILLFFFIFLISFSFKIYAIERVGCLLPLNKDTKYFSLNFLHGLSIPLSEANIQTVVKNTSSEDLQKQLKELIQKDRVDLIAGPFLSRRVKVCVPVVEGYSLPLITPFAPSLYIQSPYVFRFSFHPDDIRYLVDFAIEKLYSEDFMMLCPDTAYGFNLRTVFMDEVIKKGGHVVKIKIYKPKDMEYSSCIKQAFEVKEKKDEGNFAYEHGVQFDTLFITGNSKDLQKILSLIAFYDIYPRAILGRASFQNSTFFSRYFSESGSIYFRYTPIHQNVYEKVYTDDKDVILFWKIHMLYYVKTDRLFKNLEVEIPSVSPLNKGGTERGAKFFFDVSTLEYKKDLGIVVEIDGKSHDYKIDYDKDREEYLKSLGLKVIHILDIDIKKNLDEVMKWLKQEIENTLSLQDTPLQEGNIDIPETLSNILGKWIKKIASDYMGFKDEKIDLKNLDYKLIKPLIWW